MKMLSKISYRQPCFADGKIIANLCDTVMTAVVKGSGNVFADLGLKNPIELQARADLTHQIYKVIKQKKLNQTEAAELLGLKQPDVSALMNGKLTSFSLDRLLHLLVRLNREVEIIIKPAARSKTSTGIHVFGV